MLINQTGQHCQPTFAIIVIQGNAAAHLGHVGNRMEVITVIERPAKPISEHLANGGLAAARNAHEDDDHVEKLSRVIFNYNQRL